MDVNVEEERERELQSPEERVDVKTMDKEPTLTPHDHLMQLFTPMLIQLESSVNEVSASQSRLSNELTTLMTRLKEVKEASSNDQMASILEEKAKRLIALKRRLTLVHTLIQNSNERCRRLIVQHKISTNPLGSK